MHHMNSEEISSFWEFERRRYRTHQMPLVFSEVYHEFIAPQLRDVREDWDNASDDFFLLDFNKTDPEWEVWRMDRSIREDEKTEAEKVAHTSWENCRAACLQRENCYQWYWHDEVCSMQTNFRLGRPMKKEEEEIHRSTSGWDIEKINKWIAEEGQCAGRVEWPDVVKYAIHQAVSLSAKPLEGVGASGDSTQGAAEHDQSEIDQGTVVNGEAAHGEVTSDEAPHEAPAHVKVSQGKSYGDSVGSEN